jgi:hypothetical protein
MKPGEDDPWVRVIAELKGRGIGFEDGLSESELRAAEFRFGFRFPPDLRAFLAAGLPVGDGFPDWRDGEEAALRDWLDLPRDGIEFDIRHNDFWLPEWGAKPGDLAEAVRVAERLIAAAPRLIPVYIHRMMPDEPAEPGNPVFSVHQTDIIYYGFDLLDYLNHEFGVATWWNRPPEPRPIRFWDLDRFLTVRWAGGSCVFDNRRGILPESESGG